MRTKTIVFVHGMYMTPLCWEGWVERYRSKGYRCLAPAWPGRDRPVNELRQRHPDPQLGQLTLTAVLEHFQQTIRTLDEAPVVIGHSMGGLVVQLLLQDATLAAGVAIDSAPPMGVFTTRWSFLKANWGHITPFAPLGTPVEMGFERFQYAFVNGLPPEEQRAAFDRYVVPESRRVPRESLRARVDFSRPHPPLLLIAGGVDHIIPSSLNASNHARYKASRSVADYREFPGRTHYIIGQKGWEEVADFTLTWLDQRLS